MLGGVQVIPFHRPPKKRWEPGAEKKKRLVIDLSKDEDEGIEDETFNADYEDDSESSEESEEEFDMQRHIEDLLPGDLVDGMKPKKAANDSHLVDLRVVRKKVDRFAIFKAFYRYMKQLRAQERERRKHYILKEWEAKIKLYEEQERQAVLDKMEAYRKEVLLEKYRSAQRRIRNSRKKVEKSAHIAQFTSDLDRRDKEAQKMQYYCTNLSKWAIEGYDRRDQEVVDAKRVADEAVQRKMESDKAARKLQLIAEDAQILEEDKRVTKEIETMMVKYGMIEFERDLTETQDEMLDGIFGRQKSIRAAEKSGALTVGDNDTLMKLNLKKDLDLVYLRNKLRKNMHKRTATVPSPFVQDLSGTGQILTLKAEGIKEAGALSLAAELTRGACPMLETLNLNKCEVRSDGIGRIFQGIKTANLLSIRVLKLKGNFIRAAGLQYMQEVCPSGVFMNLSVLDISENELGDDGVTVIVNIILQGHFMSMVDLNLSANSITDQGFNKMVSVMKSLKDAKCPLLERLRLENNLVSAKARRSNAPYPIFFSI